MPFWVDDLAGMFAGVAEAATWRHYNAAAVAYSNNPAAGDHVALSVTNTAQFAVGGSVEVSSATGKELAEVESIVENTSVTVDSLALDHAIGTIVSVSETEVDVIFDDEYFERDLTVGLVATSKPEAALIASQVTGIAKNDVLVIDDTEYRCSEPKNDAGMIIVELNT